MKKGIRMAVTASVAVVALTLGACSSSGSGNSGSGSSSSATGGLEVHLTGDYSPTDRDEIKDGGELRLPINELTEQQNVFHGNMTTDTSAVWNWYNPQVVLFEGDGTYVPNPDYLTDVKEEVVDGNTVVTYTIHPDATYNDGTSIDWRAFEATWKANSGADSQYVVNSTSGYKQIKSVAAGANDKEVVVTFDGAYPWSGALFNLILHPAALPFEVFDKGYLNQLHPEWGAGPYKVENVDFQGGTVTFVPNEKWWGDAPKLDRVTLRAMEAQASLNAFRAGEIDSTATSTKERLETVRAMGDNVELKAALRTAFSEAPSAAIVQDMITVMRENESFFPVVTPTGNPRTFHFVVSNIAKKESETMLEVTVDGKAFNSDKRIKREMGIPALTPPFKLLSAEVIEAPEHGVCLTFSSPVSNTQDLNGLITLEPISSYTFQVEDNKVKIFFERKSENTSLYINVDQGLKNVSDESLPTSSSVTLQMNSLSPQVEFLSSGTIMPDSKELVLPFRAVNLYAVDLKVIRIFESNVLMFLQDNSLSASSSSELRRSGRLIYKKMLRLDSDPTKNIHDWDNYFIDLSGVMKQEPGAIYRVELSFKQDYSAYPCGNEPAARNLQASNALTRVEAGEMTEEDEAVWDQPQTYYYDNSNIDWGVYEWDERDNPCHPSYYMVSERKATTNVMASNMGVIVKGNTNNTLWVAVSNLLDAKPMSNVEVTAYNFQLQPIGKARTDGDGFALIKAKNKPFVLVVSSEDKQKTYLRLVDGEDNLLSRFDVGGKEIQKGLRGFVYGERGVWRPGDTLHVSFMLEDREKRIPANHPVSIEVYNPRGQFYQKQVSAKGLNGLYTFTIPTKADDPTGLWNAYVKVGGTSFHKPLRIETVKPNRLKINLTIPGKQLKASTSPVQATLESAWLTGAVAQNLKTKVELMLSETTTRFKGYEKYIFHNPATDFTSSTVDLYSGTLNGEGKSVFRMSLPAAKDAPGMLRANITCRVFEPGGDASIYTQTIPFSPFESYVGIHFGEKGKTDYLETDVDHQFEVVTLSPDGQPTNRSGLEYKIYKVGWSWWWEHDDESFVSYLNTSCVSSRSPRR